ncbi:hypothetical protein [Actinoalloteichus caeruleus]|uniref:hypothetical protein n=1 Tax=Actinoalloteichus cyanogriseus TaxID=2893586 RepID=UPI0004C1CB46|nr:hypothetical protein [Actinoalloteichus caeruleus]
MRHGHQHPTPARLGRRALLAAGLASGALAVTAGVAQAARPGPARGPRDEAPRVVVATNEPWGTYHVAPLLDEARARGLDLVQLVPDLDGVAPDDPVPVATPDQVTTADLLVVTGAEPWPVECVDRFRRLPVAASTLAYLRPEEAEGANRVRSRIRAVTASSPADARSFAAHLGSSRRIDVVGSPQTDSLPTRDPEPGLALVLTSVTHPDETGGAAPGARLLLEAASRLRAAGWRILVGLHPREDPALWGEYEISPVSSLESSARAEVAIGIPGTVFPLIAAVGTPLVGCVDPGLSVPDHLRAVCSATIQDTDWAASEVERATPPDPAVLADAVGPLGGSARRLLDAWQRVAATSRPG